MAIVSFPVLTVAALEAEGVEAALKLPFPQRPSFELLHKAGQHILAYLDVVVTDLAQTDALRAASEIQRAAARLVEIAVATPASLEAALEADTKLYQAEADTRQKPKD